MRPEDRENNVAEVLARSLLRADPGGPTLVVGEATGRVWRDLDGRGDPLERWDRFAVGEGFGAAEPTGRDYASIALRLPKSGLRERSAGELPKSASSLRVMLMKPSASASARWTGECCTSSTA